MKKEVYKYGKLVFEKYLVWALLVLLVLVGSTIPGFLSPSNILNVFWSSAPMGCMVLGLFFVLLTGELDLSLESTFAVAPTVAIVVSRQWMDGSLWGGYTVVLVLLLGIVAGLLNGLFVVQLQVNALLVTLGTLLTFRGVVIFLIPEGVYDLPSSVTFVGNSKLYGYFPVAILVLILLYSIAWLLINRHVFGRNIFALGSNSEAAYIAGVNISRTKITSFALAGLFSSIGGLLEVGRLSSVTAGMGEGDILMVFAATILGGTSLSGGEGRVTNVFAAVIFIGFIENILNLYGIPPSVRQIIFGTILLTAIYLASLQGKFEDFSKAPA